MGLDTGSVDKLDHLLFPTFLLLRVSPLVLAQLLFLFKHLLQLYTYLFLQGHLVGIHQELLLIG
jgi:hypothetical protein